MPPVAASVSMPGCAATWPPCGIERAFSARCSISSGKLGADLLDALYPAMTADGSVQTLRSKSSDDEVHLSPGAQPREQLCCRPAIGRQTELELRVADSDATLEAEHAVDAADVVAALFQKLLQLARFLEGDFWNVRGAAVHGRRAVEARGVVGRRQRIVERLVPLQIGLEIVVGEEGGPEPS